MSVSTVERPQHLVALEKANAVRFAAAALRREVAALPRAEGLESLAELLLDPPEALQRMRVDRVVRWPHRVGPYLGVRYLNDAGLTPSAGLRCVGPGHAAFMRPLTPAQRRALAAHLRTLAAGGVS